MAVAAKEGKKARAPASESEERGLTVIVICYLGSRTGVWAHGQPQSYVQLRRHLRGDRN
jgi:hypothetical protein